MANDLSVVVPKIIGGVQTVLRQEFLMAEYVKKDFEGVAAKKGSTVTIPIAAAQSTYDVTPGPTPPALVDKTSGSASIAINKWKGTRFHMTAKEATEIEPGRFVPGQLQEAVRAILYDINADIFSKYPKIYGYAGTAATNPFATNINPVADVREVLGRQNCPKGARKLMLGHAEETAALKLGAFNEALKRGDALALKQGELGDLFGFRCASDQQVPTHTAGTGSGYLINNGAGYAAGVKTVVVDTGTGTLIVGDIISFAGVTGTYTVTSALAANSVSFEPGLEGAVADDAAITKRATHKVNLAFDPEAFGLIMRLSQEDMLDAEFGMTAGTHIPIVDPQTKAVLMLSNYPGYHASQWELSALWGAECIVPARAGRLAG